MANFRIIPLSRQYAAKLREKRTDDFGNTIIEEVATGLGPCRVSLQPFKPGQDKRLVLSHSPFEQKNAYNQPGPVFIFSGEVEEYADVHHFPVAIRELKEHFVFTLIGYNKVQWMVYTKLVKDNDTIDELISNVFDRHPEIEYLHARSAIAACYICKIIRD
jgi:Protein of unknown function (DUF1203)